MNPLNTQAGWLATGAAARALKISPNYIRTLADKGRIVSIRTPLGRLFDPVSLEEFASQRAAKNATQCGA